MLNMIRKEQLWGEKLQISTEKLLKNDQLQQDITKAKLKINQIFKTGKKIFTY